MERNRDKAYAAFSRAGVEVERRARSSKGKDNCTAAQRRGSGADVDSRALAVPLLRLFLEAHTFVLGLLFVFMWCCLLGS